MVLSVRRRMAAAGLLLSLLLLSLLTPPTVANSFPEPQSDSASGLNLNKAATTSASSTTTASSTKPTTKTNPTTTTTATPSSTSTTTSPSGPPVGPVRKWLANLTFHIPDINTTVGSGVLELEVNLTHLECHRIELGAIKPTPQPPLGLSLSLSGLGVSCYGRWLTKRKDGSSIESGAVNFTIADSTLGLGVKLVKRPDGLAGKALPTDCEADIKVSKLSFEGAGHTVLNAFAGVLKATVHTAIKDLACPHKLDKSVAGLLANELTKLLNATDTKIAPFLKPVPPAIPPPVGRGMFDLRSAPLVQAVDNVVDKKFGLKGLLGLVEFFTKKHPGSVFIKKILQGKNATFSVAGIANITVGLDELNMTGLDSWTLFDLLEPVSAYALNSQTAMTKLGFNMSFFIKVDFLGKKTISGGSLTERAVLFVNLTDNVLNTTMQLAVRREQLKALGPLQVTNVDCLLTSLADLNITQLTLNTTVKELGLVALSGDVEQDLDDALDSIINLLVGSFGPAIPAFLNGAILNQGREGINAGVANASAKATCPSEAKLQDLTYSPLGSGLAFGLAAGLSLGLWVILLLLSKRQARMDFASDNTPLVDDEQVLHPPSDVCLALRPEATPLWRYGVSALLLFNAAFFVGSNTGVGAEIALYLNLDGYILRLPSLFSFTLANSVRDMWKAGVYPLSLLVAIFSGAWPYTKIVLMMVAWFCPSSFKWMSVHRREQLLMFLDKYGKYSLLDSFILIFMVVGFHVDVALSPTSHVQVFVEPGFGTYFLLVGTLLSLVLSHLLLHFHRKTTGGYDVLERRGGNRPALSLFQYKFTMIKNTAALHCNKLGLLAVAVLLTAAFGMIILGSTIDSFAFEFKGAAAVALTYFGDAVYRPHSLLSIATDMPQSSATPNGFGIRMVQASFLLFAFVVPLIQCSFMVVLFFRRFTPTWQSRIYTVAEILRAWAALDVFVLSLIAAVFELEQLAQFIVGSKCDAINKLLAEYFDKQLDGDDKCFDLIATVDDGTWTLLACCFFSGFVTRVIMKLSHGMLEDLAAQLSGHALTDPEIEVDEGSQSQTAPSTTSCSPSLSVWCCCCRTAWRWYNAASAALTRFARALCIALYLVSEDKRNSSIYANGGDDHIVSSTTSRQGGVNGRRNIQDGGGGGDDDDDDAMLQGPAQGRRGQRSFIP